MIIRDLQRKRTYKTIDICPPLHPGDGINEADQDHSVPADVITPSPLMSAAFCCSAVSSARSVRLREQHCIGDVTRSVPVGRQQILRLPTLVPHPVLIGMSLAGSVSSVAHAIRRDSQSVFRTSCSLFLVFYCGWLHEPRPRSALLRSPVAASSRPGWTASFRDRRAQFDNLQPRASRNGSALSKQTAPKQKSLFIADVCPFSAPARILLRQMNMRDLASAGLTDRTVPFN